jgi:4-amino-4-deoxy-L-arabinose transferase-like glycosyltransferase
VAVLVFTWRAARTDRTRAAVVLWGGWLLVTGFVFSYAQGIIHPYYNVALAPAVGALVGIGTVTLWHHRRRWPGRLVLAVALAATVVWSYVLLARSPDWFPWLRPVVLAVGLVVAVVMAVAPGMRAKVAAVVGLAGLSAALAGPVAYALDTVATPHSGAIPSAGPAIETATPGGPGGFGGFGLGRGPGGGRGGFGGIRPGFVGANRTGSFGGVGRPGGSFGGFPRRGQAAIGTGPALGGGFAGRFGAGRLGGAGTGGSGFLNASTPGPALVSLLEQRAGSYRWVAATVNSNSAAGYQLATDDPVMAIGGFNGTDPAPSLAQFEKYVSDGDVHYFIGGGGGFGGGGFAAPGIGGGATADDASQITSWVESHYTAETIGGVTVYNLTATAH